MKTKIFSLISAVLMILVLFIPTVSADETESFSRTENSIKTFLDGQGAIIGVSSKGEWDEYPENSVPAIKAAAETDIDFVLLDVKKTSDGTLIIFSDDTTERMLSAEEIFTVSATDYKTLSEFYLKKACGGSNEKISEYKIPTLEEAIACAKENDIPLILRSSASLISDVTDILSENNALSTSILMTDGSKKEITSALSECEQKPYLIGTKKGNVIFAISSYVSFLDGIDACGVELKTGNRYGINYYYSVVGGFSEKMRVIANPTVPEECGARQDSEKWWSDLISRGYSVIITDHADMFSKYKERTNEARERLQKLYDKYVTNHTLPVFKDENLNDLKKAYTDAVSLTESLLADKSSSFQDLNDGYAALSKAANDININFSALEDGSAGTTVTLPRILLCIAAVIVVIAVQIYFFKRRKKEV
ncbi:MAG: hypothetical protein IKL10_03575 [Clostridia bacterium]|nr:hypothetical protein [Clostridia bacterium]